MAGSAVCHELVTAGDEVGEGVLLVVEFPSAMPGLAHLAAPAGMAADDDDATDVATEASAEPHAMQAS